MGLTSWAGITIAGDASPPKTGRATDCRPLNVAARHGCCDDAATGETQHVLNGRLMAETSDGADLWWMVPHLLGLSRYCVLATADLAGAPWATPVFFAARDDRELFWVSSPNSRHSKNLEGRPTVGITVFDSTAPVGRAEALYLDAHAAALTAGAEGDALEALNEKLGPDHALASSDLYPTGPLQAYRATVTQHYVLIRGGDARFDNVVDQRLPVRPPEGRLG
jgi:hypothetical protein